jgi:hypothetical protein
MQIANSPFRGGSIRNLAPLYARSLALLQDFGCAFEIVSIPKSQDFCRIRLAKRYFNRAYDKQIAQEPKRFHAGHNFEGTTQEFSLQGSAQVTV